MATGFSLLILAACRKKEERVEAETETTVETVKEEGLRKRKLLQIALQQTELQLVLIPMVQKISKKQ